MGVQGLWTLLSPAGRKLKLEALEGHRLAIDVSIWVIRMINGFANANRQDFKNAHLIGIFKRLCRLLSLGIKPVFVFDGKAPELKRKTLYQRQQQREKRQQNLQKLAEKYVIRQLEGRLKANGVSDIKDGRSSGMRDDKDEILDELDSANSEEMNQFERDTNEFQEKIVNLEFEEIVKKLPLYPNLLEGIVASKEEFHIFDITSKLEIVQQANQRLSEIRSKDLSSIKNMEEFSKMQAKNYVDYISSKRAVSKERDEGFKQIAQSHEAILIEEASRSLNPTTRDKLNTLANQQNRILTGTSISDHNTTYLFMQNTPSMGNQNPMQGRAASANSTHSRIGAIAKPVRKTKFEKGVEVQQRIAELLRHKDSLGVHNSMNLQSDQIGQGFQGISNNRVKNDCDNQGKQKSVEETCQDVGLDSSYSEDFAEEIISIVDQGSPKGKINQPKQIQPKRLSSDDSDSFSFGDDEEDDDVEESSKDKTKDVKRDGEDDVRQSKESQASASPVGDLPDEIDELMNQAMMEDTGSNSSLTHEQFSLMDSTKLDSQKEVLVRNFSISKRSSGNNERIQKQLQQQQQQPDVFDSQKEMRRIAEFLEPLKRNGYEVMRERMQGESRQSSLRSSAAAAAATTAAVVVAESAHNVSTKIIEEKPIERETQQQVASEMQVEEDIPAGVSGCVDVVGISEKLGGVTGEVAETEERNNDDSNNNNASINKMMECFTRQEKKSESMNGDTKEKEKADFQKLIALLQEEEMISKMSKEQAAAYKKEQKKEKRQAIARGLPVIPSTTIEEEVERVSQQINNNLIYSNGGNQQVNQAYNEEEEEEEEEEVNQEEIRKLLDQVEKWEDEQNQHVNDGIDLTDEQLENEFQRFVNLSEIDSESIQTKFQQVRQLLLLFGVPWVEAPSEAEAQCAYLEQISLVDGSITDDSDVFLFGARKVYRGLFAKGTDSVRYIDIQTISRDLGVDRDKLIKMALFLGSDYTLGIKGVGIVNAMEIVSAFESMDALQRFKVWANKADVLLEDFAQHYRNISLKEKNYKEQHKNYKKNWELPDEFPSQKVVDAYLHPNVDESHEPFQWGSPNIPLLRAYCANMFNWDAELISFVLEPLTTFLSRPPNPQKKITDYYKQAQKFAMVNSNRLKSAIGSLTRNDPVQEEAKLQQAARVNNLISGIQAISQNLQDQRKKTSRKDAILQSSEQNEDQEEDDQFNDGLSSTTKQQINSINADSLSRFAFYNNKANKKKFNAPSFKRNQHY